LWIHDRWLTAIFTQKLLTTCAIFAILDNIRAMTFWTVKYDYFADHLAFIPSFRKAHYPYFCPYLVSILPLTARYGGQNLDFSPPR
jgi:hypothetical protein